MCDSDATQSPRQACAWPSDKEYLLNHNHHDRGVYHHDCQACQFLAKLMAEAGYAQPNQAAFGTGEAKISYRDTPDKVNVGGGGTFTSSGYPTVHDPLSPPPRNRPSTEHLRVHLARDHNLPLDLGRQVLLRVHESCHRRNYFHPGHYLTNDTQMHTGVMVLTHGHNPEASETVQRQLRSIDHQQHREARLRQASAHGNRESVLRSQRITAAIGKAKAGLEALQKTNGRRAGMIAEKIRDVTMYAANGLELHYGFDRPYTYAIAQLVDDTGLKPYLGIGKARCSADDTWDAAMGANLALGRAMEDIGKQMITGATYIDELRNARRGRV